MDSTLNNKHGAVTSEPAWQTGAVEPEPAQADPRGPRFFNTKGRVTGLIAACAVFFLCTVALSAALVTTYFDGRNAEQVLDADGNRTIAQPDDSAPRDIVAIAQDDRGSKVVVSASGATVDDSVARNIALEKAGVSADQVKNMTTYLRFDDGIMTHHITFSSGTTAYEFEIDAFSGKILEYEIDGGSQAHANPSD
jgi:hypothetical protein